MPYALCLMPYYAWVIKATDMTLRKIESIFQSILSTYQNERR
jgi:hypothetical protein